MEYLQVYILTIVSMVLVQNYVLARFLGLCPFIGVSKRSSEALGMGLAVTFVMVLASIVTWLIYNYFMLPHAVTGTNLFYMLGVIEDPQFALTPVLKVIAFILVIASLVQFVEMFLHKMVPSLYVSLGIYLPLITTNCAVMGVALLNTTAYFGESLSLIGAIVQGVGAGLGFMLAMMLMSAIREKLELLNIPAWLHGSPLAFLATGCMAVSFLGFAGLVTNDDMIEPAGAAEIETPADPARDAAPNGRAVSAPPSPTVAQVNIGEGSEESPSPDVPSHAKAAVGETEPPEPVGESPMRIVLATALALAVLGGLLGAGLAIASKAFHIEIDPRQEQLTEALPGLNCGACGYAGCSGYAEAVARGEVTDLTLCKPGGPETAAALAAIMGQEAAGGSSDREVAVLYCHGVNVGHKYDYAGVQECDAAAIVDDGPLACRYGCIGLGTCTRACNFDALVMGPEGLPVVIEENCVACGACVEACPKDLFKLVGVKKPVHIRCASHDKGAVARKACQFACIACRKCVKECPVEAISIEENLAVIDYEKCIACGKCVKVCPDDTIINLRQERKRHAST
jgi:RnfABCDGE-type electron transport complex B subunit